MVNSKNVTDDLWQLALEFLPSDLDERASLSNAIRRPRNVSSAEQLLRGFLLYAQTGSFRTASAQLRASGLVELTSEGLFYRLKNSVSFLEGILSHLTQGIKAPIGYRLLAVDATTICGPGATHTDWRVHVAYDPLRGLPTSIVVGDHHIGEGLAHLSLEKGELILGDRAYGKARDVHAAHLAGAKVLVRVQQAQMRLLDDRGERVNWKQLERKVPEFGAVSFQFKMPVPPDGKGTGAAWKESEAIALHSIRLVAARTKTGEVIWLLTTLTPEELNESDACDLYRVRWQIELYFKRLKSIGDLDVMGSRDGPTAKATLLAKLILLTLTSLIADSEQAFPPYGYPIKGIGPKPLARIRTDAQKTRRVPTSKQRHTQGDAEAIR